MGLFDRNEHQQRSSVVGVLNAITWDTPGVLASHGYHYMMDAPEVASAVWLIADLISTMPIHLMENRKNGDVRIHDQLARKIDVEPWSLGTRQTWMHWIVSTMLTDGESVVIPQTSEMMIADLIPAPDASLWRPINSSVYYARYAGHDFEADNILHFRLRPDSTYPWRGMSVRVQVQSVVDSIIQTASTKTAYMSSEYKPPIVIAVDTDTDLADKKKRSAFLKKMWTRERPDEPLIIPANMMKVDQLKPLSLTDLAIRDGVELDKKTVATIFGIPGFLLGVGSFNRDEYNTFIARTILPICRGIEQELTKKLLVSTNRYFRFNARALYSYSLQELSQIALNMRNAGLMTGNEGRNWMDLPPKDGLDELVMLENYVPANRLGDQKKLNETKEVPNEE